MVGKCLLAELADATVGYFRSAATDGDCADGCTGEQVQWWQQWIAEWGWEGMD